MVTSWDGKFVQLLDDRAKDTSHGRLNDFSAYLNTEMDFVRRSDDPTKLGQQFYDRVTSFNK